MKSEMEASLFVHCFGDLPKEQRERLRSTITAMNRVIGLLGGQNDR